MIGHLDGERNARNFADYLFVQGIDNQVEAEKDGSWAVWIMAEEHLERAKSLLAGFRENPADAKFTSTKHAARELRDQKQKEQEAYEKRLRDRRHLFRPLTAYGFGPLTFVLICVSVVVYLFQVRMGDLQPLYLSTKDIPGQGLNRMLERLTLGLPEIKRGEVWRLVTPIFMHGNILHILFNMLWLRDLGSMIEARQGSLQLAILVLAFAVISNLAQYIVSGPLFYGMSGVVYGLAGYIWIRGKRDPGSGLFLHPSTVTLMIIWFFLGFTGFMPMANTAHGSGLLAGMLWGFLSSLRYR
jgi:GlpG protein